MTLPFLASTAAATLHITGDLAQHTSSSLMMDPYMMSAPPRRPPCRRGCRAPRDGLLDDRPALQHGDDAGHRVDISTG